MKTRVNWSFLYLMSIGAMVVLFQIKPTDTSGYLLWVLGTYFSLWMWVQLNQAAMIQSSISAKAQPKKIVHVRYEFDSREERGL